MLALAPLFTLTFVANTCTNKEFDKCGGKDFSGETCCQDYDSCNVINEYYSQCQPKDICLVAEFGQCDGIDHEGKAWDPKKKCCPPSFHCEYQTQYYSQCKADPPTPGKCAQAYAQCGGQDAAGKPWGTNTTEKTCCIPGYHCALTNKYYSGCNPDPICTNPRYGQCGGIDAAGKAWTKANGHDGCCPAAFKCVYQSQYFSQCVMNTTVTTTQFLPTIQEVAA